MIDKRLKKLEYQINAISEYIVSHQDGNKLRAEPMIRWIQNHLKIRPKSGGVVPFILKKQQKILLAHVVKCIKEKRPVRVIVLKSRQIGFSTLIQAIILYLVHHYPETKALVLAHQKDSTQEIFSMTRRYWDYLPDSERKPLKGGRPFKGHLDYEFPHNSEYRVLTAGGDDPVRGQTYQYVHLSEEASFEDSETLFTALGSCVPDPAETWFSFYFKESTAKGLNRFKDDWDSAQDPESIWTPFFFSWKDEPESRLPVPSHFHMTDDEIEYAKKYGLDEGQIAWARQKRIDDFNGSWEWFHQEYPVSEELAFRFSGNPIFDPSFIQSMIERSKTTDPIFRGDIEPTSMSNPHPHLVEQEFGPLSIWKKPQGATQYYLGGDVSLGVGAAYSELIVLSDDPVEVVAHYRSNRIKAGPYGVKCWLLGAYYRFGLLGIEANAMGEASLDVVERGDPLCRGITKYPNLFYHTKRDEKTLRQTQRLGFSTSEKSKDTAIAGVSQLFSQGDLDIWSWPLLHQMAGYKWMPNTEVKGRQKKRGYYVQENKDPQTNLTLTDGIMALAIANEMRRFGNRPGYVGAIEVVDDW